jgi:hypothetical protein
MRESKHRQSEPHSYGSWPGAVVSIERRNNVHVHGNGLCAMMFAHGFGCDQNMWRLWLLRSRAIFALSCSTTWARGSLTSNYIASQIAQAHRGKLNVTSDTGQTEFTFAMPLAASPA